MHKKNSERLQVCGWFTVWGTCGNGEDESNLTKLSRHLEIQPSWLAQRVIAQRVNMSPRKDALL